MKSINVRIEWDEGVDGVGLHPGFIDEIKSVAVGYFATVIEIPSSGVDVVKMAYEYFDTDEGVERSYNRFLIERIQPLVDAAPRMSWDEAVMKVSRTLFEVAEGMHGRATDNKKTAEIIASALGWKKEKQE